MDVLLMSGRAGILVGEVLGGKIGWLMRRAAGFQVGGRLVCRIGEIYFAGGCLSKFQDCWDGWMTRLNGCK